MKKASPDARDLKIRELERELLKQRRVNEALRDIQLLQNTILEKSMSGYCIFLDGKIYAMNPIAVSFTGFDVHELIGRKADFLVHPEDRAAVKKSARAMLSGERKVPYEFRILTKQKEVRWVVEAIVPIMFQGKPAVLANAMDVTQRKLVEEKLIESENLYRTIFETTGTMTMIGDENQTISLLNTEFENITGFYREYWEGRKWTEYVYEQDAPRLEEYNRLRQTDSPAAPKRYEYRLINNRGQIKHILATVSMIPGTKKYVSSSMDIRN